MIESFCDSLEYDEKEEVEKPVAWMKGHGGQLPRFFLPTRAGFIGIQNAYRKERKVDR